MEIQSFQEGDKLFERDIIEHAPGIYSVGPWNEKELSRVLENMINKKIRILPDNWDWVQL